MGHMHSASVEHILAEYEKSKHQLYGEFCNAQAKLLQFCQWAKKPDDLGGSDIERLTQDVTNPTWLITLQSTLHICKLIAQLNLAEQIELVGVSDVEILQLTHPNGLMTYDVLSLKREVYEFVLDPVDAVQDSHAQLCYAMKEYAERLN